MSQSTETIAVPFELLRALLPLIDFRGHGHVKVVAIDPNNWNPSSDYDGKIIEFITDPDTTRYTISEQGQIFNMSGRRAFQDAYTDRIRFVLAFTLPTALIESEDFDKTGFAMDTKLDYIDYF